MEERQITKSQLEAIRIIFILSNDYTDESEASDVMLQAYEACKQYKTNVTWVKENELESMILKKTDFIIFDDFKGKNFDKLKNAKSAILGPWCVMICLMECKKIPNFPWPIYNVAMYDCVICCSHIPKKNKIELKERIQAMGGFYTDSLVQTNTHLVTDCVKTEKYVKAAELNLKLMLPSWVEAIWEASQRANIHGNDEQFGVYRCRAFNNLTICATGITNPHQRQEVCELIKENGGAFTGTLNLSVTDILLCNGVAGCTSNKYKAARNTSNVQCVTLDWLYDSIKKGYALPYNMYMVKKSTSTPNKSDLIQPDFSMMSAINDTKFEKTCLEETALDATTSQSHLVHRNGVKRKDPFNDDYNALINEIDVKRVKKNGPFLDGCSIYLVGFESEQREKLCKILNFSGATRYDDISDRVTHVIVGDTTTYEVRLINSKNYPCSLVTMHWLLDSIKKGQPVNEDGYLIKTNNFEKDLGSPLGRKGLNLLRSNKNITENDFESPKCIDLDKESEHEAENDIMKQYLQAGNAEDDTLMQMLKNAGGNFESKGEPVMQQGIDNPSENYETQSSQMSSQSEIVFQGMNFFISGFDDDQYNIISSQIEYGGGNLVTDQKHMKYVVVPVFVNSSPEFDRERMVNEFWINECIQESKLCEIRYYHQPILLQGTNPLENCVVTISSFYNFERNFLKNLIEQLGGTSQEQFARITSVEKNILGSTHLVSQTASGKKYVAAIKWKLPVVSYKWLLECARLGELLPEKDFPVGEDGKDTEEFLTSRAVVGTSKSAEDKPSSSKCESITAGNVSNLTSSRADHEEDNNENYTINSGSKRSLNDNSSTPTFTNFATPTTSRIATPVTSQRVTNSKQDEDGTPTRTNRGQMDGFSPVTPINKIMKEVRMTNLLGTPDSPVRPKTWDEVDTPETPYGAYIEKNPSSMLRKEMLRYINQFPDFVPPPSRRKSTPLSELKRKLWDKLLNGTQEVDVADRVALNNSGLVDLPDSENVEENAFIDLEKENSGNTDSILVNNKLLQLEEMLTASAGKSRRSSRVYESTVPAHVSHEDPRNSQPFTVQWDYGVEDNQEPPQQQKIFMISSVEADAKILLEEQIEILGGRVSEFQSYDPSCTHLVCGKPARNEKTLSCMAAGKWILHVSYIENSAKAKHFLDEEDFEFGNPKSLGNINVEFDKEIQTRMHAIHYWRRDINRRGYGAFHDMRAIIVASKKDSLIRVLEAGGGTIINADPPFEETVHVTHCLIEPRSVSDFSLYVPLAVRGVFCVNTVYISDFLHRITADITDSILPYYTKYHNRS